MALNLSVPTPLAYFASLVHSDEGLPVLEAAASLAQDEMPELDVQQVLSEVDQLVARLQRRLVGRTSPLERLGVLNHFFFKDLGFAGNVNDYYNPDNSYLNVVLHTRRGIPISLAVLWLELAQSAGLNAEGISFPGHFLVQASLEEGKVVIDPLTGQSLGRSELRERVSDLQPATPYAPVSDATLALYLCPATARQVLSRMLHNLQDIFRTQADWPRFVQIQDRLITLLPDAWAEYRDRGLALADLGEKERARADLRLYLRQAGDGATDRALVAERLAALGGPLL